MDISLKGGVLIIGSLLWDSGHQRTNWRNNFLQVNKQIPIPAPIRYGRVSKTRNYTFTMVYSNDCNQNSQQGKGIFIPFITNPINFANLELQTQELIKSERKKTTLNSERFHWDWGALTIAVNPEILIQGSEKYNQAQLLLSYWGQKYSDEFKPEDYRVGHELPVLDNRGVLKFKWTEKLNEYDFVITTATKPEQEHYPTSKNIADKIIESKHSEYFKRNIELGISTFQDKDIIKLLTSQETSTI